MGSSIEYSPHYSMLNYLSYGEGVSGGDCIGGDGGCDSNGGNGGNGSISDSFGSVVVGWDLTDRLEVVRVVVEAVGDTSSWLIVYFFVWWQHE